MNFHFHFSTFKKEKYFARQSSKIMVPLTNTKNGFHSSLGVDLTLKGKSWLLGGWIVDSGYNPYTYCTSLTDWSNPSLADFMLNINWEMPDLWSQGGITFINIKAPRWWWFELDEWFYLFPEVGTLSKVERPQRQAWEEFVRKDLWELTLMWTHSSRTFWPVISPTPSDTTSGSVTTTGPGAEMSATVWTGTGASWGPVWVDRTGSSPSSSPSVQSSSSSTGWSRARPCVCSTGKMVTSTKHTQPYLVASTGRQT